MQAILFGPSPYLQELARRRRKIPIEEFSDGPQGLKYYDIVSGAGAEAKVGQRVAVHYDVSVHIAASSHADRQLVGAFRHHD